MDHFKLFKLTWIDDPGCAGPNQYRFFSNRTAAEKAEKEIIENGVCTFGTQPLIESVYAPKLKSEMIQFLNALNGNK